MSVSVAAEFEDDNGVDDAHAVERGSVDAALSWLLGGLAAGAFHSYVHGVTSVSQLGLECVHEHTGCVSESHR